MRRTWWEFGISAVVLLLVSMSINCADLIGADFGRVLIEEVEPPGDQENAYTCECNVTVFGGSCLTIRPLPSVRQTP